jgi:glucose-1-phosphate adenylyltransferase
LVDLVIMDKRVRVGRNAVVGTGDKQQVNQEFPSHLYTGITLLGKGATVPDGAVIGRNCIVNSMRQAHDFPSLHVPSGATV